MKGCCVLILNGKLYLSHKNDDYTIVGNGRLTNLSEMLNVMLFEDVRMKIVSKYDGQVLFDVKGKLVKKKMGKCFYLYHIEDFNIDEVLWRLVDRKIEIDIKNITKE